MQTFDSDPAFPVQPGEFYKAQLRRLLGLCFSLGEIKTLAFDIGLDYDELGGETKTSKIRDLIIAAEREDRLETLITAAEQMRSHIHWPRRGYVPEEICPYRGLLPFGEENAPYFFGRESFVKQLAIAIRQQELVAVVGSSGSGKSSVVFAGLLPQLRQEGDWLITPAIRPGLQPFDELARALIPLLEMQMSETDRLLEARKLSEALQQKPFDLSSILNRIGQKDPTKSRLLLVVDQFEELYSAEIDDQTRRLFVDGLLRVLKASRGKSGSQANVKMVLTLRADFMGRVLDYRPLADALQDRDLKLGPMTQQELVMAIQRPAGKLNLRFEVGLIDRMLDDLIPSGLPQMDASNLPLLEFALEQLWTLRTTDGLLTHEAYDAIGEAGGAISRYADELYEGMTSAMQTNFRSLLVQMVHPGGVEDTRRWVTRTDIGNIQWDFIEQLAAERLVVTDRDGTGQDIAEVIHEALIQKWNRMQGWMQEERPFRVWQDRMRLSLIQWEKGASDDDLLRGTFLAESLVWLQKRSADLSSRETDFIRFSAAVNQAQKGRFLAALVMTGGVGAGLFTFFITALAGYLVWPLLPDYMDPPIPPRPVITLIFGLLGALLGGSQGSMTVLGVVSADRLSKKTSKYERALGGGILGALTGGFLFVFLNFSQIILGNLSLVTVLIFGFLVFGLSSAGAALVIKFGGVHSLPRQTLLGMIAAGIPCFLAILGLYGVSELISFIDLRPTTPVLPTVLGYTALESMFGGGLNFGLWLLTRQMHSRELPHSRNSMNTFRVA
jgi:hypothetical protein